VSGSARPRVEVSAAEKNRVRPALGSSHNALAPMGRGWKTDGTWFAQSCVAGRADWDSSTLRRRRSSSSCSPSCRDLDTASSSARSSWRSACTSDSHICRLPHGCGVASCPADRADVDRLRHGCRFVCCGNGLDGSEVCERQRLLGWACSVVALGRRAGACHRRAVYSWRPRFAALSAVVSLVAALLGGFATVFVWLLIYGSGD
jgi:hypothetical protein